MMSRIDQLIKEYCSGGVEYTTLGDCIIKNTGGGTPSKAKISYWDGDIPWASVGDLSINGIYIQTTRNFVTEEGLKNSSSNLVQAGDLIVAVKIAPGKAKIAGADIAINQDLRGLTLKPFITSKFLAYYFQTITVIGNGTIVKGITKNTLEKIKIPIPPLPVQQAIVDILDSFTKLEAELEAELEARQKQYAYYRDELLNFDENKVNYLPMGQVGTFVRGNGLQKKDFTESGVGCIHYGQLYTHYGTYADQTKTFTSASLAKKLRKAKKGDLVIATTSENDEDVCKAVAWLGNEEVAVSGDAYIYQHSLNPKYVAYFFMTDEFQKQKRPYITGTKVRRVSGDSMSKIKIPIPTLKEQTRIVAILDKFDALVNDISHGLPAEIKARRQQYEHYRNRLLTFEPTCE